MRLRFYRGSGAMLAALALTVAASACGQTATGATPPGSSTPDAPVTPSPSPTATMVPMAPTSSPTAVIPADSAGSTYLDDRSTPESLMRSLADAINRRQYLRAYSYWEPSSTRPAYADYEKDLADVASVELTLGTVGAGAAAGNLYYSVPAAFTATTSTGSVQTTAGCYTLHLAQPRIQDSVPFRPLAIQSAIIQPVAHTAAIPDALGTACTEPGIPQETPAPVADPADISAERYLDDRSGPVQVVRSLYNAINRKEYARAYSYWQSGAAAVELAPYEEFRDGYAETATVQLITGVVRGDAGAGQRYYSVPVVLTATTTGKATHTFVGCYELHLSLPEIQGTPPFQPLAITSATVNPLADGVDAAATIQEACPAS